MRTVRDGTNYGEIGVFMERGTTLVRLGLLVTVALSAVTLYACQPGNLSGPLRSDPGEGSTMADQVYRLVKPVVGEQVEAPNPDNAPYEPYLAGRVLQVEEEHPEFGATALYHEDGNQRRWGYADGSVLVLYSSPQPGPQLPPPGPNTGTKLDAVKIIRP